MIKKFNEFVNESFFGDLARFRGGQREESKGKPFGRGMDDKYAMEIFDKIVADFEAFDKDLNKVKIMNGSAISYVFGKYDAVRNSTMSGNKDVGSMSAYVSYIAPGVKLTRDELDKSFGVSRGIKFGKAYIKIENTVANPKYDPNFTIDYLRHDPTDAERDMLRIHDTIKEEFKITYDIAKKFIQYFVDEYDRQYPEYKDAESKNAYGISDIKKGTNPVLGYVDVRDPNRLEIIYPYTRLSDKKKIEDYIKKNPCVKAKSSEGYPVTYFTEPGEDLETAERVMATMSKEEILSHNRVLFGG